MAAPKVLVFAGSLRRDSYNKKLAAAAATMAEEAGAEVTHIDLRDYPLPPYDGDIETESGIPEPARQLRDLMRVQDGFIIASPEYNSSIPGTLKNVIDWVSRPDGEVSGLVAFQGKKAALISASPGRLGGMRGLVHLRDVLENVGTLVLPDRHAVSAAHQVFDDIDALNDGRDKVAVNLLVKRLVKLATRP